MSNGITIGFYVTIKYVFVTDVPSMTTLKTKLSDDQWKKWTGVKSDIGGGKAIHNDQTIERLIDFYNQNKHRKLI